MQSYSLAAGPGVDGRLCARNWRGALLCSRGLSRSRGLRRRPPAPPSKKWQGGQKDHPRRLVALVPFKRVASVTECKPPEGRRCGCVLSTSRRRSGCCRSIPWPMRWPGRIGDDGRHPGGGVGGLARPEGSGVRRGPAGPGRRARPSSYHKPVRDPKRPPTKRQSGAKVEHVSFARLLKMKKGRT